MWAILKALYGKMMVLDCGSVAFYVSLSVCVRVCVRGRERERERERVVGIVEHSSLGKELKQGMKERSNVHACRHHT